MQQARRANAPSSALRRRPSVLLAAAVLLLAPAPSALAQTSGDGVTAARVQGATRYDTAANIATLTFDSAAVAHVVSGADFPDALAASYGAGITGGPVLLVPPDDLADDSPALAALDQLGVERVVLVGGEAAISASVEQELAQRGYDTERISGVNRYQTASSVAMSYGQSGPVGELDGDRTALLASGEGFADALAAGPVAADAHFPLFLTPSDRTEVSVNHSLRQLGIERIVVVGGSAAVSSDVVTYYQDQGYEVERWSGPTRTATAATVADNAVQRLGFAPTLSLLARGDDFADALAASVHAAANNAPLLLTAAPDALGEPTRTWLAAACPGVDVVRAIGGRAAVTAETLGRAVDAAEACATAWTTCSNPDDGYTVEYPSPWATNTEPVGELPPCSLFDPDPEEFHSDDQQVSADVAVHLDVEQVAFDEVSGAGRFEEEVSRRDTTVAGRRAERIEVRATGEGYYPEGTLTTRWAVDLGGATFIAVSHDIGDPVYEEKVRVLDRMMRTITFADAAAEQTFGVAPQEPVTHTAGTPHEFGVFTRYDGQPFTGPVDVALFACGDVDATGDPVTFTDADGDGTADGLGTTDSAAARIVAVNGTAADGTVVRGVRPGDDGTLRIEVNSPSADCAVLVVFDDVDDDGQLAVDADARAAEPFGVGQIRWTS